MRWHMFLRRWRRGAPLVKGVFLIVAGFIVVSIGAAGLPKFSLPPVAVPALAGGGIVSGQGLIKQVLGAYQVDFIRVLDQGLPLACLRQDQMNGKRTAIFVFPWLSGSGPRNLQLSLEPLELVQSELAWFELAARGSRRSKEEKNTNEPLPLVEHEPLPTTSPVQEPPQPVQQVDGPPRIAIYHTHTSEDYVPTAGASHTYGKEAGIVAVGRELRKTLEERHGICCLHNTTVHDAPVYREAYLRSGETVAKLLQDNSELEVVLDIHRDAPTKDAAKSRAMTTTTIDDQLVARVYIVVGTDRLGLAHPNWKKNHEFALSLQQQLEALYPGLSRGIKIDTARFNQQLHSRLILIEIGGEHNSLDEAKRTVPLLADALAAWFRNQD
ncbi:MAG: stage II sporulation protein P [bacterium]